MTDRIANRSPRPTSGLVVVLVLLAAAVGAQTISGQVQKGEGGRCCLTNFRYSGICEVRVGSGESCGDALSYLNNFQSAGQAYCGNSIIRGGWTLVRCGSTGGGAFISPETITAHEPSALEGTAAMAPIGTVSPGTLRGSDATFITPIEVSTAAPAAAPGLIDL